MGSRLYKKYVKNSAFMKALVLVYNTLYRAESTDDLKSISWLHYEKLKYNYAGKSSVRVINNMVERIIFTEHDNGIRIKVLELDTNHYGNKK